MNKPTDASAPITCREARRRFAEFMKAERAGMRPSPVGLHLESCGRCAREYRVLALTRAALDLAAAPEPVRPDEDFFTALRARLARGPEVAPAPVAASPGDSWAAAILLTARQLLPVMALLLLVIISATFIWGGNQTNGRSVAVRPSERVIFNDVYDYDAPTPDDVLQTLVAVEERENGK